MLEAMRAVGFKIYGSRWVRQFGPAEQTGRSWPSDRRSTAGMRRASFFFREYRGGVGARRTAAEHAGGATGRWDSVGLGRNGARETWQTYWFGRHHRRSNGNWPATRGGGETVGLHRDGGSSGWCRQGTSLGARGRYGEGFPSVKMTERRLPR